ncbi:MAG: NAD(P)H-dependent flavin oxidoreductase, partial [Myxococcota bacterium]
MSLHTRICDVFGIEVPIVLAGMGGASTPELVAAVSNAGGLGILGAATCGPERLRRWIGRTRELTDRPFGVDTLLPASVRRGATRDSGGPSPADRLPEYRKFAAEFMEREKLGAFPKEAGGAEARSGERRAAMFSKDFFDAQMEVVIDEGVPVYAAGLGSPGSWVERLHDQGCVVMSV